METPSLPKFANIFLPSTNSLSLDNIRLAPNLLELHISNCASQAGCPECNAIAYRIHSHYQRKLTDLPYGQIQIRIFWSSRRFFCDAGNCKKITFAEQIPMLAVHHARKTNRLVEKLRQIGFEAGGEAGRRLADIFGIAASGDQILRLMRSSGEPNIPNLKVVGIDDWACFL